MYVTAVAFAFPAVLMATVKLLNGDSEFNTINTVAAKKSKR